MSQLLPAALYAQICASLPIACVDLLVRRGQQVLLVRRGNEPARGCWWFPGGRVLYRETRRDAARRKLLEECGLRSIDALHEVGTFDLIFPETGASVAHHGITTLFEVFVENARVVLDGQSTDWCWLPPARWLETDLHPFVKKAIEDGYHAATAPRCLA